MEFEVTREMARNFLLKWEIEEYNIFELEEPVKVNVQTQDPQDNNEESLKSEYRDLFGKDVPKNKSKDIAWIQNQIISYTK